MMSQENKYVQLPLRSDLNARTPARTEGKGDDHNRSPLTEKKLHCLICFALPVSSSKMLKPYVAALGGVYTIRERMIISRCWFERKTSGADSWPDSRCRDTAMLFGSGFEIRCRPSWL